MSSLKQDLIDEATDFVETHTAWVFLKKDRVWKVKKPVDLGFLDFTTLEKRRAACEAEVKLNSRLAGHVYLGVDPITLDPSGRHRIGGEGEPVEWAVRMVRLTEEERADRQLVTGALTSERIDDVAERLASFHAEAHGDAQTASFGSPDVVLANVRENFEQTRQSVLDHLDRAEARELETRQIAFVEENRGLFHARMKAGRVRDGHGDLRLEHVYLGGEGSITIIDCIEFNDRFRYADVCSDVAFLSMDLMRLGRADLAERLIASYAGAAQDYELYRLVDFYEGYRAYVRAKVASILAADPGAAHETRRRAFEEARRYYLLALATGRRPLLQPVVVAMGGIIASGKSTVAEHLSRIMSAPVISSDRTRKALLGVTPTQKVHEEPWGGAYSESMTRRVYGEIFRRARHVVSSGRSVILDASFRSRGERRAARELAEEAGLPFYFVECRVPAEECRKRLRQRERQASVSDGRLDILHDFASRWEPVDELPAAEHLTLDTSVPLERTLESLRGLLPTWPAGLTA